MGMGLISQIIVQSKLRLSLLRAAPELGLHYFLCRINLTAVVKLLVKVFLM